VQYTLRPATDSDREFLLRVYGSTRAEELSVVPWDEQLKQAFIEQQFTAQDAHYKEHYADASFDVIEIGGEPAGRLYVHRGERDVRIVDIALLPEFRGRGVGGAVVEALIEEAGTSGRSLSIHVEANNRARTLYDRLGLVQAGAHGVYLLMEWRQPNTA
jgi:ribosomal protein S18 acetylase RimI-like enzyme